MCATMVASTDTASSGSTDASAAIVTQPASAGGLSARWPSGSADRRFPSSCDGKIDPSAMPAARCPMAPFAAPTFFPASIRHRSFMAEAEQKPPIFSATGSQSVLSDVVRFSLNPWHSCSKRWSSSVDQECSGRVSFRARFGAGGSESDGMGWPSSPRMKALDAASALALALAASRLARAKVKAASSPVGKAPSSLYELPTQCLTRYGFDLMLGRNSTPRKPDVELSDRCSSNPSAAAACTASSCVRKAPFRGASRSFLYLPRSLRAGADEGASPSTSSAVSVPSSGSISATTTTSAGASSSILWLGRRRSWL
mmetsp:Transcript_24172/g.75570  ORF Transcript_24172/g.75570 Transcript_24172/m.75570 type:complete len:313 (-) Transcript_24172:8-946(-)